MTQDTSNFRQLAEALRCWPESELSLSPVGPPVYKRLISSLASIRTTSPRDLAGLVRHLLMYETERAGGSVPLLVPRPMEGSSWPNQEMWTTAGVGVGEAGSHLRVVANPWSPTWLKGEKDAGASVAAEQPMRHDISVPGDPFLSVWTGHQRYSAPAQKQALRAALYADPGSCICVLLPTGVGKSLIAHLPALLASENGGVSIVVVPTVSLALDQERGLLQTARDLGFEDRLPSRLAHHGGLQPKEKRELLERVREGSQRIVFVSPEALLTSFGRALYEAAEAGFVKYLVIDEAHLVAQWGSEFRPEFQSLAGLKRDLMRVCPSGAAFRTILMTATLTAEGIETLHALFGEPGNFHIISGLQLRAEPKYQRCYCVNETEREERLIEAVHHLPRPIIVYATRRRDVDRYHDLLCKAGYTRIEKMHGDTPNDSRAATVERWDAGEIDIIVATSAFGVGVNNPHVRSVVHACIPENLDRFYQEVGRGGRDGCASLSLLLYTAEDYEVAAGLNKNRLITTERGLERWNRMFVNSAQSDDISPQLVRVSLDVTPSNVMWESGKNRAWNASTLNLMARAGMVRLSWRPPPVRVDVMGEAQTQIEAEYEASRFLEILDNEHSEASRWQTVVEPLRDQSAHRAQVGFESMRKVVAAKGSDDVESALRELYTVHVTLPGNGAARYAPRLVPPVPPPVRVRHRAFSYRLTRVTQGAASLGIRYVASGAGAYHTEAIRTAVTLCLHEGITSLVDLDGPLTLSELTSLYEATRYPFFIEREIDGIFTLPALPALVMLGPNWCGHTLPSTLLDDSCPRAFLYPEGMRDPFVPHLPLDHALGVTLGLDAFVERML